MARRCETNDAGCEIQCNTKCFRCGLEACKSCSSAADYLHYGIKRICNNCMREGISHNEPWAVEKVEFYGPPPNAALSSEMKAYWQTHAYKKRVS